MKKVAVIIVNWNGLHFLKDCLTALFAQSYKDFDVYFVDNGSEDRSVAFVREHFPQVKIVPLAENTGFAKGNNEGIRIALQDPLVRYIVCLNNDTIVDSCWLDELIKTAVSSANIGGVSSKAYFDDAITIQNAGLEFSKTLQMSRPGGVSLGYGYTDADREDLSNDIEVFAPGGVAALYRRDVVEKLLNRDGEFFDEDFFAYVEDYDVGFRIRKLGYTCVLSARATLIHLHSKTGGVASPFKAYYIERNIILTAIKNLPMVDLLLFPCRNLWLKVSYLLDKNESVEKLRSTIGVVHMLGILLKAYVMAIKLMPKFIGKRIKTQNLT